METIIVPEVIYELLRSRSQHQNYRAPSAVGHETDPTIGGKVLSTSGNAIDGFTLELANPKTHWRSGKVVLRTDGTFIVGLLAEKGERNIFNIELFDRSGARQKTVPDHLRRTELMSSKAAPDASPARLSKSYKRRNRIGPSESPNRSRTCTLKSCFPFRDFGSISSADS